MAINNTISSIVSYDCNCILIYPTTTYTLWESTITVEGSICVHYQKPNGDNANITLTITFSDATPDKTKTLGPCEMYSFTSQNLESLSVVSDASTVDDGIPSISYTIQINTQV